ncbi:nuclear speckle splicing regulatory protein 1 isoform X2 [Pungitius pungitius]|uniref:nuclear speckle splicing regulatory protein 1 isoform X2 n=1 Tax=Pungitius pungitius TaxID=134920 RepID=UPI002E112DDA
MAAPTKQYGLILSQKKLSKNLLKHSVFEDDSDDEITVGETLQKEAVKKKMMKQTRLEMHKALEQDSSVYDYDAVYDDIQKQRLETNKKLLGGADKKPKYIQQLMKAVEDRKKEQERRDERKIQKEREAEGEQFADKDAYVTSAYKLKLQEQKEELEKEKRVAAMEAALDVKKQNDLSGFYRHLLNQTVGEEAIPDRSADKAQNSKASEEPEKTSPVPSAMSHDKIPSSCSDSEEGHEQKSGFSKHGAGSGHSKRQYRQRSPSSGSGEEKERAKERERHTKRHRDQEKDRNRGRERDDRHGGRRDDRDGRKDRDRGREDDRGRGRYDDRGREDDRGRGRDTDREDRHGKREMSPKEREKDRNGEREKRRNQEEDKRKDKDQEEEKESKKHPENEKAVKSEETDPEKKEAVGVKSPELKDDQEQEGEDVEEKPNKFAKRSTDQTVGSARDRYMARQIARSSSKTYIEKEED